MLEWEIIILNYVKPELDVPIKTEWPKKKICHKSARRVSIKKIKNKKIIILNYDNP